VILPMHRDILETTPLLREELVLAVPKAHALARRRSVSIAELRGVPLVMFRDGYDLRATTVAACRRAGFEPTFALEGGEMDGVLRLTAAGLGVAVVPSLVVDRAGPLRAVRIAKPELTRTIGLAHRRDRRLSRAAQEFIATVRALIAAREWLARVPAGLTVLDGAAAPRARRVARA
jgi:DNA-binding transcriptional LysR family regulator